MPQTRINYNGEVVQDAWEVIHDAQQTSVQPNSILPKSFWQDHSEQLTDIAPLGVWLDSDQEPNSIAADLERFEIIGINFPTFMDGRGFSSARLLRERYGYQGDIRAIGDVIQDQLFYMVRCGFSSFELKPEQNIASAIASLKPFSSPYQAAVDTSQPLFRRRASV